MPELQASLLVCHVLTKVQDGGAADRAIRKLHPQALEDADAITASRADQNRRVFVHKRPFDTYRELKPAHATPPLRADKRDLSAARAGRTIELWRPPEGARDEFCCPGPPSTARAPLSSHRTHRG
jgi:hypothetical protein